MGGINITDPLVLEERILDMQYRNRHLEKELRVMRSQNEASVAQKKKMKEMSNKIIKLEEVDEKAKQKK